jgi:hypothetical protein
MLATHVIAAAIDVAGVRVWLWRLVLMSGSVAQCVSRKMESWTGNLKLSKKKASKHKAMRKRIALV